MAEGGIACFEQFLLSSQCFQKSSAAEAAESIYSIYGKEFMIVIKFAHHVESNLAYICLGVLEFKTLFMSFSVHVELI